MAVEAGAPQCVGNRAFVQIVAVVRATNGPACQLAVSMSLDRVVPEDPTLATPNVALVPQQRTAWSRLRPEAARSVELLADALTQSDVTPQDLVDSYLYAKRVLAGAMQAFLRDRLPEAGIETFRDLREQIRTIMFGNYSHHIPARYLRVPYGSRVHSELFAVLFQRLGEPVEASFLRIVTADSVHTERRTRELRELGLNISAAKSNGIESYTLCSLDVDASFVPSLISKNLREDNRLRAADRERLLALVESN